MNARVVSRLARPGMGVILILCGLLLGGGTSAISAQTPTLQWSRPIPISGALQSSRLPSIVAMDDGNVFLFWTFAGDGRGDTVYVSKYDNGAWLRPIDVLVGGPHMFALMDGRETMHVLVNQGTLLSLTKADITGVTSVQGWSPSFTVTHGKNGLFGDMVLDPNGALNIVWLEATTTCEECYSVAYEKYGGATAVDLTYRVLSDVEKVPQQRLQIVRAPKGTLYAIWDRGAQGANHAGIALSISTNDGAEWLTAPRAVSFDQDIIAPLLWLDKENQLVMAFRFGNKDEVYYTVSTDEGVTWSAPAVIPGLFANRGAWDGDYFAAATDSAGITHFVGAGRTSKVQQTPGLYHLTWDGKQWGTLEEIYHADTLVENPTIAIGNGNRLHVSFGTRNTNAGDSFDTSQVWYSNAQTDAPAATRVPLPTFTPQPTSTDAPTPVPTNTRIPSPTPVESDDAGNTPGTSSIDTQLPIVAGVVPVILILLGAVLWTTVFRRRR